ncbi:MAG: folate-binding protein YgfZ [Cyanobacteria bacterium QS_8_64_29]|nr:MAG: folate-binding protein YgfZ [Cyanobacteria bacterium QS_8_64_29]
MTERVQPAPTHSAPDAARQATAIADRSHCGLISLSGEDCARFLQNQSTNDIQALQPGQGCQTVFVSSTARTVDLGWVYATESGYWLLVSPQRRQTLVERLDRYLFPLDRVELADRSDGCAVFVALGPNSDRLARELGAERLSAGVEGDHQAVPWGNATLRVAAGSGLALPGYTVIAPTQAAESVWVALTAAEVPILGERDWEQLRVCQGRPIPDHELTEDYNPLEAGLIGAISFHKGCYIGQETITRLNTYKGVKQRLWGIRLPAPVTEGTPIAVAGKTVGALTSCVETAEGGFGLGYVKTKAGGAGTRVSVGETEGELVAVPFLDHSYYDPGQ